MKLEAALFDMDGTLMDSHNAVASTYIGAVKEISGVTKTQQDVFKSWEGRRAPQALGYLLERESTDDDIKILNRHQDEIAGKMTLFDGVAEALAKLSERIPLGIYTGAPKHQALAHLYGADIMKYLSVVIAAEDVENFKPAPDGVLIACEELGVEPKNVTYAGDSPNDLKAARAAGAVPVAISWGAHFETASMADLVLSEPSEIADLPELGTELN